MTVSTTPKNAAASAVPSDCVAPWICEPTHSHSSGVPTHSPRLPMNMIATTRSAPVPDLSSGRILVTSPGPRSASADAAAPG